MTEETTQEATPLERLPIHAVRSELKAQGIEYKLTDKKADLIKMLRAGETVHKKEVKQAPTMDDHKHEVALPVIPKGIRSELEALQQKGLTWEINESNCSIKFMRDIPVTTTLDQSENNILSAARQSFATRMPVEVGHNGDMFDILKKQGRL